MIDAHLAALALEHGASIATTDRDFTRFPSIRPRGPDRSDLAPGVNRFEPASGRAAAHSLSASCRRSRPPATRSTGPAPLAVREIKRAAQVYLEEGEQAAYREIPAMRARTANSANFAEGIVSSVGKTR
ncbi:MAG: hypothetical protein F4Y32_17610 [Holophagales bacterium]|nr:hypothetical protein [Holophagales bacterium]